MIAGTQAGSRRAGGERPNRDGGFVQCFLYAQITDCRSRFELALTPEEQAEIAEELANDRDGRTRGATALAQREAARQLGSVTWADVEGRAIVAQVEAWQIIEDAADRCVPGDAGEDAGRKLRFYLHALAVRAELDGRDLESAVGDAVFCVLAGDRAAKEAWRRLDERDGEVGLWVGVLLSPGSRPDADLERDAAQTLRRLRKAAWTHLREWIRNAPHHPDDRKAREPGPDPERWRKAVTRTNGRTLAGALALPLNGDRHDERVAAVTDTASAHAAEEQTLWNLHVTLVSGDGGRRP